MGRFRTSQFSRNVIWLDAHSATGVTPPLAQLSCPVRLEPQTKTRPFHRRNMEPRWSNASESLLRYEPTALGLHILGVFWKAPLPANVNSDSSARSHSVKPNDLLHSQDKRVFLGRAYFSARLGISLYIFIHISPSAEWQELSVSKQSKL